MGGVRVGDAEGGRVFVMSRVEVRASVRVSVTVRVRDGALVRVPPDAERERVTAFDREALAECVRGGEYVRVSETGREAVLKGVFVELTLRDVEGARVTDLDRERVRSFVAVAGGEYDMEGSRVFDGLGVSVNGRTVGVSVNTQGISNVEVPLRVCRFDVSIASLDDAYQT